jgi:hypothetical protein
MKDEDVKIGMKVKILSKFNGNVENSKVYRILKQRKQNYAYVSKKVDPKDRHIYNYKGKSLYVLSEDKDCGGDFYTSEDFEECLSEIRKAKLKKLKEG